jgi:hypothetical protein
VGRLYFGQVCLVSWRLSIPEWKFSVITLLDILHIPLAYISSPSMPMILRFGILMESLSFCIFLS